MDISLGLSVPNEQEGGVQDIVQDVIQPSVNSQNDGDDDNDVPEIMTFPANCSHCNAPCDTKMHILNVPHFKEVVMMSTTCDVSRSVYPLIFIKILIFYLLIIIGMWIQIK